MFAIWVRRSMLNTSRSSQVVPTQFQWNSSFKLFRILKTQSNRASWCLTTLLKLGIWWTVTSPVVFPPRNITQVPIASVRSHCTRTWLVFWSTRTQPKKLKLPMPLIWLVKRSQITSTLSSLTWMPLMQMEWSAGTSFVKRLPKSCGEHRCVCSRQLIVSRQKSSVWLIRMLDNKSFLIYPLLFLSCKARVAENFYNHFRSWWLTRLKSG